MTVLLSFCWRKRSEQDIGSGSKQEGTNLDERTDDTKRGEAEVLEGARFRGSVQERV